jgi:hypothetical protein
MPRMERMGRTQWIVTVAVGLDPLFRLVGHLVSEEG